jgi:hypothetical protein
MMGLVTFPANRTQEGAVLALLSDGAEHSLADIARRYPSKRYDYTFRNAISRLQTQKGWVIPSRFRRELGKTKWYRLEGDYLLLARLWVSGSLFAQAGGVAGLDELNEEVGCHAT